MSVNMESPFRMIGEVQEKRNIVRGDIIRRHTVWRRKGIGSQAILEGTLEAVFNSMYAHEGHPRAWLNLLTYIEEQAKFHRDKIMDALPDVPDDEIQE